jgi:hypothetical protein
MKKGLLLAMGLGAGLGLMAQAPLVNGVKKVDLTLSKKSQADAESMSFYNQSQNSQRSGNGNSVQAVGTQFSSSHNGFTLLVSQSECLTANEALGVVLFTHRKSIDNPASVNSNSGTIQATWTLNNGGAWDSLYYDNDGSRLYRYPSGAIFNPSANTTMTNAYWLSAGPYTAGSWDGYYFTNMQFNNTNLTNNVYDNGSTGVNGLGFPRISMIATPNHGWVTAGLYGDVNGTTAAAQAFRGAAIVKATPSGSTFNWTVDSIKPNFHQSGGSADAFTLTHLAFSPNGMIGYAVFFGVDNAAVTSAERSFLPLVWKTTDAGTTWTRMPLESFASNAAIQQFLIPASNNTTKAWFSQSEGSDVTVDNNGNLHIFCEVGSGASDDNDSLGFTWTRTGGGDGSLAKAYMYDVFTTSTGWDAWLVDSLMSTSATNNSIFTDGSAVLATDARMQISRSEDGTKMFYCWTDTRDFSLGGGENAFGDLYGKARDLSTNMATAEIQFTTSQDFYFHYNSNTALPMVGGWMVPTTNSNTRNGSNDMTTIADHYYVDNINFPTTAFNVAIGVNEQVASFGSVNLFPNPANEMINVSLNLVKAENVSITMFNAMGQAVMTENRDMAAGATNIQFNTANLAAGVYFVNVAAGNATTTTKVVVE